MQKVLLISSLALVAASNSTERPDATTVGGTTVFTTNQGSIRMGTVTGQKKNPNSFIKIDQLSLVETSPNGTEIKRLGLGLPDNDDGISNQGRDRNVIVNWTTPTMDANGLLTTTFSKTLYFNNKSDEVRVFTFTAHVATNMTTNGTDFVRCQNCTADATGNATFGSCQNVVDKSCMKALRDPTGQNAPTCNASGYSLCTVNNTVVKNTLKFSFSLEGWRRFTPGNYLTYQIAVSSNGNNRHKTSDDRVKDFSEKSHNAKRYDFDTGFAVMPAVGYVNSSIPTAVNVTDAQVDNRLILSFTFVAPDSNDQFYYDPTFGASDPIVSTASAAFPAVASLALAALLLKF